MSLHKQDVNFNPPAYAEWPQDPDTQDPLLGEEALDVSGPHDAIARQRAVYAFCGIRASEPMVFYVIFPFLNEMMLEYGISKDKRSTGYAAGVLEATLTLANFLAIFFWIRVGQKRGRRPVLVYTTLAVGFFGSLFGFQRSFFSLLLIRGISGAFNGQSAVAKAYLAEVVTKENEAFSFTLMSLAWQIGWCFSASVGGYLAHAERHFPALSRFGWIQHHPYALPCLIVSAPSVLSALYGYCTLVETRPTKEQRITRYDSITSITTWTAPMWKAFQIWTLMVLINVSFQSAVPLFLYAPVAAGGLEMPTSAIGTWFVVRTAGIMLIELPIYPRLHKRFGTLTMLKGQLGLYLVVYSLPPIISTARRWMFEPATEGSIDWLSLSLLGLLLCTECLAQTMFISGDLLCTNAAPNKEAMPFYSAVVEAQAKLGSAVSVWMASFLFAYSAETQALNGYLVWVVLWVLVFSGCFLVCMNTESRGWRDDQHDLPITPLRLDTGAI